MATINNPYFRATMEYLHDISAGAFPGAVLAAWMIRNAFAGGSADTIRQLEVATVGVWLILLACLVLLVATGAFRLRWWRLNVRQGALEAKQRMAWIKHTAFTLTLIAAVVFTFTLLPN